MEGIIINLFKDVQQKSSDANKSARKEFPNLVWTNYDRVKIKPVKKMEEYFLMADDRNAWTGSIQTLHLYTEGDSKAVFTYSNEKSGALIDIKGSPIDAPAFFCIASFRLDYNLKRIIEWGTETGSHKVNKYLRDYIYDFLFAYCGKNKIHYEIYNSLGAEDIVIIFVSNSIKKFATVIEGLRNLKYKTEMTDEATDEATDNVSEEILFLFETSYSFVGINNTGKVREPGLNALISLTVKDRKKLKDYFDELQRKNVKILRKFSCFGEYDFRIEAKSSLDLIKQYQVKGLFTADSSKYSESIYQSQTTWIYRKKDLDSIKMPKKMLSIKAGNIRDLNRISQVKKEFEKDVKQYESLLSEGIISKIPHFKEECAILLSEYKRHMNSTFIRSWWLDLELQFKTFIKCLKAFIKDHETKTDGGISAIEDCIEDIKETYMHISQANRIFFEVSEMMRYYNGSYNNIVRAYYGLIRFLISIGYEIPHDERSKQPDLAFGVSFDMKPKINSILHLWTSNNLDNRLISFNLPYSALYDIPKYLFYLIHEVFHYITPINREVRNKLIFKICMDIVLNSIIYNFFVDIVKKGNAAETYKCSETIIGELIKRYVEGYISKIIEDVVDNDQRWIQTFSKSSDAFEKDLEDFFLGVNNKINVVKLLENILMQFFKELKDKNINMKNEIIGQCEKKYTVDNKSAEREVRYVIAKLYAYMRKERLSESISADINYRAEHFNSMPEGRSIEALIQEIGDGLSEAICDMYIINILNLPFYEYIENLMSLFDEISYIKVLLDTHKRDSLLLRMGILVDLYSKNDHEWFEKQVTVWEKRTLIKDRDKIAKKLLRNYRDYLRCYGGYRVIISEYIHNMDLNVLSKRITDLYDEERCKQWKRKIAILRKFYSDYRGYKNDLGTNLNENINSQMLNLNLEMIEFFQSQSPIHIQYQDLKNLDIALQDKKPSKSTCNNSIKIENVVSDISQYIHQTTLSIDKLKKNADDSRLVSMDGYDVKMWFRGVCNSQYLLAPSIFRGCP